jgi:hypothetical protein
LLNSEWSQYHVTFYSGKTTVPRISVILKPLDPGTVWVQDLEAREGTADIYYRLFDGGIVIVNGSNKSVTVDPDVIAPGMKFKAIDGTHDASTNNGRPAGSPAGSPITIPPLDARVLVR